jgi:lysophospholipid acyltransferase (LPLAT)-like uncharacterized protein
MKKLLYQLSLLIVPPLYWLISSLLFLSCRVKEYGREDLDKCSQKGPFIAALWHYSVFCSFTSIKGKDWVAMVSGSKDAEYVSELLNRVGVRTVRGSRGKGGLRAIKDMVVIVKEQQRNAVIIADGSQGPARKVQAGAILLASKSGTPIIPTAWALNRYKAFRSWDRTILPMPFAKMVISYGEPLYVPAKIKAVDLEKYRLDLESRLNGVYHQAWSCFGKKRHDE